MSPRTPRSRLLRLGRPLLCAAALLGPLRSSADPLAWQADSLVKVFRDARPPADAPTTRPDPAAPRPSAPGRPADLHAARGEYVSVQIVARADAKLLALTARADPLALADGSATLPAPRCRFVGYVPVRRATGLGKRPLRPPPADYPDPLLETPAIDVPAGSAQPVWLTLRVPADARPGLYRGSARLAGRCGQRPFALAVPFAVRVHAAAVPPERHLWVTNWFDCGPGRLLRQYTPPIAPFSDDYWALMARLARNMADHRQNVALISPLNLARYGVGPDGQLTIDFARFDRMVQTFIDAGVIGRIEGGHMGGRSGEWRSPLVVQVRSVADGKVVAASVAPASPQADAFYARFFPALLAHLKAKGWLGRYLQHVIDEPIDANLADYLAAAGLVRKYAPGLRIVEATYQATDRLAKVVDVWVPQLPYYNADFHRARQRAGDEVWFYTCLAPPEPAANRLIGQPLVKTRYLHWLNYKLGATGYLHWGWNQWRSDDPFGDVEPAHGAGRLPAGDGWIVYPARRADGLPADGVLDSIRHEAMRDGIEDYELLRQLADRDRGAADALVNDKSLGLSRDDCGSDVSAFRTAHRRLLEALDKQK